MDPEFPDYSYMLGGHFGHWADCPPSMEWAQWGPMEHQAKRSHSGQEHMRKDRFKCTWYGKLKSQRKLNVPYVYGPKLTRPFRRDIFLSNNHCRLSCRGQVFWLFYRVVKLTWSVIPTRYQSCVRKVSRRRVVARCGPTCELIGQPMDREERTTSLDARLLGFITTRIKRMNSACVASHPLAIFLY